MDLGALAVASSGPTPWRHGVRPLPTDLNGDVILIFNRGILLHLLQSFHAIVLPSAVSSFGWTRCHLLGYYSPAVVVAGESGEQGFPKGFIVISFPSRGSYVSLVGTAVLCTGCTCVPGRTVFCMF
jgi:hypothetical protein